MDFTVEEQKLLERAITPQPSTWMMGSLWGRSFTPIVFITIGVWGFFHDDNARVKGSWLFLCMGVFMLLNLFIIIAVEKEKRQHFALIQKLAPTQGIKPASSSSG